MKSTEHKAHTGKFVIKELSKTITASGNSGHIITPKEFIGETAEVKIIQNWFICQRCNESFVEKKNFSTDPRYCKKCLEAIKFLEKNRHKLKCHECGSKMSEAEFSEAWNQELCGKCLKKAMEQDDKIKEREGDDFE